MVWYSGDLGNEDYEVEDHHEDLTSPDKGGDVLDSLQVGGLLGIGEGLLLEGLGVVT